MAVQCPTSAVQTVVLLLVLATCSAVRATARQLQQAGGTQMELLPAAAAAAAAADAQARSISAAAASTSKDTDAGADDPELAPAQLQDACDNRARLMQLVALAQSTRSTDEVFVTLQGTAG
jgi:hypothetical protein